MIGVDETRRDTAVSTATSYMATEQVELPECNNDWDGAGRDRFSDDGGRSAMMSADETNSPASGGAGAVQRSDADSSVLVVVTGADGGEGISFTDLLPGRGCVPLNHGRSRFPGCQLHRQLRYLHAAAGSAF